MCHHEEIEETRFDALVSFYVTGMGPAVRSAEGDRSKVTGIGGIATQVITVIVFLNYERRTYIAYFRYKYFFFFFFFSPLITVTFTYRPRIDRY
jgi:hypothetical protein